MTEFERVFSQNNEDAKKRIETNDVIYVQNNKFKMKFVLRCF